MVDVLRQPAFVPRLPWRSISMAVLLIALLLAVAAVALYVGSRPRLPAPFGLASNGLVAYAANGDIYTGDPVSGASTPIVTGPESDIAPRFSPYGTHVAFERKLSSGMGQVYVVRSDGSQLTLVTPEPVALTDTAFWRNYEFSPDGRSILIMSMTNGRPTISIAQTDGSGIRQLEVGMAAKGATYRPPVGAEILFIGEGSPGQAGFGLYAVDPVSMAVRTLVRPAAGVDLTGASWSPDGARIAYWSWREVEGMTARTHIINADGSGDRELPAPANAVWNALASWSNGGTRIFLIRGYTGDNADVRPAVLPADGSGVGVELPFTGTAERECCSAWMWSPNDSKIIGRPGGTSGEPLRQILLDPIAGDSRPAPWASTSDPAWQRMP
jgi:Tol biopolymer transport system component